MRRFLQRVLRYPLAVFIALLMAWLSGASVVWRALDGSQPLPVDASVSSLLSRHDSAVRRYETVRKRYGDDDVVLIAWTDDALFSTSILTRLRDFSTALAALPGVTKVDSLATAVSARTSDGVTEIDAFLHDIPTAAASLSEMRNEALADPLLRGTLLAPDARSTLVVVQLDPALSGPAQFGLVTNIDRLSHRFAAGVESIVTGPAYARIEINRILFRDLAQVLPFAIGATLLVAGVAMGSARALVMPFLATGGAMAITVAIYFVCGHRLNFITVIVAPMVFVLGFAYAIYLAAAYEEQLARGLSRDQAVDAALEEAAGPVTLNAALEIIGFLSLAGSEIESIRLFGCYSALGISVAWIGALLGVPAGLKLLRYGTRPRLAANRVGSWIIKLARFDVRHRIAILGSTALLTLLALGATRYIDVGTDYLSVLPRDHRIVRQFNQVAERFDGMVPLKVIIESDVPGNFKDPVQLKKIAEFQNWLQAQPEIGGVVSLVDYLSVLYRAFVPDAPNGQHLPPSVEMADQLLMLGAGNGVERFADLHFGVTILHARSKVVATPQVAALVARIDERLAQLPPYLHGHVTGSSVLLAQSTDEIVRSQVSSLATTALCIYLVLAVVFGSWRIGLFALLPNVVPIAVLFGILGICGIRLDLTTSLVAPIVLAIVMDDTVHFLMRFNAEARRAADETVGVERAMATTVKPVAYSTLGLVAGFLALGTSVLTNQVAFGLLAASVMVIAWLLDLIFTPALASRLRFVTIWETLAIDLGCPDPQNSLPLFHGLSGRQARTAAILGAMRTIDAGERLIHEGVCAREIFVVIEGEAVAHIPHADGDTELLHFFKGDLLGAASLFHGRHFANVDAVTPLRVLRLGEACLTQIQRRYPRIGAQIYRNLSAIIARRLADVAIRV